MNRVPTFLFCNTHIYHEEESRSDGVVVFTKVTLLISTFWGCIAEENTEGVLYGAISKQLFAGLRESFRGVGKVGFGY